MKYKNLTLLGIIVALVFGIMFFSMELRQFLFVFMFLGMTGVIGMFWWYMDVVNK